MWKDSGVTMEKKSYIDIKMDIGTVLRTIFAAGYDSAMAADSDMTGYDYDLYVDQILSIMEDYEP
jgi:hypothetical protein